MSTLPKVCFSSAKFEKIARGDQTSPRLERALRLGMLPPEFPQGLMADQSHGGSLSQYEISWKAIEEMRHGARIVERAHLYWCDSMEVCRS
ncbi:MAG: hypothetical protein M5R42_10340 [Rhodocyclaceae bacterium]|nr:hypothetical protein [Rhodocyclaceae bacterium]